MCADTNFLDWFYCRYIDDNPWSCDMSTLQVLQMELIDLIEKDSPLENFDGGRIKCADPPHMEGKKPLQLISCKKISFPGITFKRFY